MHRLRDLETLRRRKASEDRNQLQRILATPGLSRDTAEMLSRILG
ncbi:MAG: hypothetical protein R3D85_13195 [Paracoccaceae bacterium]